MILLQPCNKSVGDMSIADDARIVMTLLRKIVFLMRELYCIVEISLFLVAFEITYCDVSGGGYKTRFYLIFIPSLWKEYGIYLEF